MNKWESDILKELYFQKYISQRDLAERMGYSLGIVNKSLKELQWQGYINNEYKLTKKAQSFLERKKTLNAIILAAGYGMRMVPINMETPKGLLEVKGEVLIERLIKQLHAVHIKKIYVVVGFLKEKFEYLVDQYGVELIINKEYSSQNNLHSLNLAETYISNSYIIPCDIWCKHNPFCELELYTWYMVNKVKTVESNVKVNRKMQLSKIANSEFGNQMIGISYIDQNQADKVKKMLKNFDGDRKYNDSFWEEVLFSDEKIQFWAKIVDENEIVEINTYEQLREFDSNSDQLKADALEVICKVLNVPEGGVRNISTLKKGMTNRSFLFECGKKYIMRIPGEGTDRLIDRRQEYSIYQILAGKGIGENIIYMNPINGYKITEFFQGARCCDPYNMDDVKECMAKLRVLHDMKLKVEHEFDLYGKIELYESFWNGERSVYRDYEETKRKVYLLKPFIDQCSKDKCLTHIDAVPDNFLFIHSDNGTEQTMLIDWEYSGMQDPHVDLAMFSVYSFYSKEHIDKLIDIYFQGRCELETRIKIYCYVAICGLLWSNWCEYKRNLGIEFGEYSLRQYRYAKEFYCIASEMMEEL